MIISSSHLMLFKPPLHSIPLIVRFVCHICVTQHSRKYVFNYNCAY